MSLLGQSAPPFTLFNNKREKISLESFKGQKVILAFYPSAFTGVCQAELCTFRDALTGLNDAGAAVLGISVDNPFVNNAFAEKNGLTYSLLSDYDRAVVRAYGVAHDDFAGMTGYTAAKRSVFVVNAAGDVSYEWIAPNPGVQPDYEAVKAAVQ